MSTQDAAEATAYEKPDGYTVFHWPEFQALAKRLTIALDVPIKSVSIKVSIDETVKIETEYIGRDATKEQT